jgi:hypothetical protein
MSGDSDDDTRRSWIATQSYLSGILVGLWWYDVKSKLIYSVTVMILYLLVTTVPYTYVHGSWLWSTRVSNRALICTYYYHSVIS